MIAPLELSRKIHLGYKCIQKQVCKTYGIPETAMDILLFLANNPCYDTATDIVEVRFLAKSQVSAAIKEMESRAYLRREYMPDNRKTAHLRLCDAARPIIADGCKAQERFGAALMDGFSPEEVEQMQRNMERMHKNVEKYLEAMNDDGNGD